MNDFEAAKRRYVELLVAQGCNVQPDQQVLIVTEPSNLDLVEYAADACYARGAKYVDCDLLLTRLERSHLLNAPPRRQNFVPSYRTVKYDQLVDGRGAVLAFRSQDEPDCYAQLDEAGQRRLNDMLVARRDAVRRYRDEGVLERKLAWCLAGPPSPQWAAKVFPELSPEDAVRELWEQIFTMTGARHEDCVQRWSDHLDALARRATALNARQIKEVRFVNQPLGTDLTVTLSPEARWVSGRKETSFGVDVCLNIPTYEVFTTPDWRGTTGTVATTRPVMINGTLVDGLKLRFEKGEIVDVEASRNVGAYKALIETPGDPTAKRLGEVALVGVDSPIFQSGRIFQHTLYDENAACHIATGMAYTVGIERGDELPPERLEELGFNQRARTHQDIMISDENTTVYADGKEILARGSWVAELS